MDSRWFKIRIALLGVAFVSGIFVPNQQIEELRDMPQLALVVIVVAIFAAMVATPFAIVLLVGLQTTNPMSDKIWVRPNHQANPFHFGNPLLFFHFAAYLGVACGIGAIVGSPWFGRYAAMRGLVGILFSLMVLAGVRLSIRVFHRKFISDLAKRQSPLPQHIRADAGTWRGTSLARSPFRFSR